MIQAFRVTKRYDAQGVALRDVSLHVPKGEFCFLTGPSGAGKTTLLRLILREELPTEGQILVGGRNVSVLPKHKIPEFRRTLGVVFQDFKLLKLKTILENVAFVLRVLGVPEEERRRRAFLALKSVGLEDKLDAFPLQLSGGEQQRVAIARALINEPELILADEPTGNLDSHTGEEIMNLLCGLRAERNATLIIATHDARVAARAPKVIELVDGLVAK